MCGIALIVSGVRIDLSSLFLSSITSSAQSEQSLFSIDDIKEALTRRGPDSLGSKKVFLHSKISSSVGGRDRRDVLSCAGGEDATKYDFPCSTNACQCITSESEELCWKDNGFNKRECVAELYFIGATLQLRGVKPIVQPLVDASGNILVYNGEIFGGIDVSIDSNDAEVLMESLGKCCSCSSHEHISTCHEIGKEETSVPDILSAIKGPWALIYLQASSRTTWFGRDAFGRRSLLVHWPTSKDSRLLLSSASPPSSIGKSSDLGEECGQDGSNFWEELPCGIYSVSVDDSNLDGNMVGEVERHEWTDPMLYELINWERMSVQPKPEELNISRMKFRSRQHDMSVNATNVPHELGLIEAPILLPSEAVLITLREAVKRRSTINTMFKAANCDNIQQGHAPVAVLFSGGLDSMILAALLDNCLDPKWIKDLFDLVAHCGMFLARLEVAGKLMTPLKLVITDDIDLLNVSFDKELAPDRISSQDGLKELKRFSPSRRWKLVEIDADLSNLTLETRHVMSLLNPARTYMDLNIGLALWLASSGSGWVYEERIGNVNSNYDIENCQSIKYKSEARILLVGSGADEQCAGYGRHRTKYRNGSWIGLHEEMKLDMQRIWKRNLGRDDRCIADNGKEARFPFLDEDVIRTLLGFPLWEIADLDQPSGKGDKKILREAAQLLGLHEAAVLPKRAIQFGSRIARESNRKNFGSNRAANLASAGSAEISRP
ncbi:hypothetical protein RHSIM_Rhsim02G0238300 [Rhododendron simsii]|uniref:Glutamine amidotransferase type-2 domain-containing protein n=1 Tax=Rhododendron simsii TaxID=118357 RepID=A0A834HMF5_RHOSS|nr:hypothetical protein RHSIM_Rhsim02G0238300 [Rhododendron simsii]